MSMPYLRIRSFSSDMVAVLMRHLEETSTKNDRKPYVIRGSMSLDSEALKRWGLNSKRDSTLQVSFVTTLRLELARNLSKSLLCPFGSEPFGVTFFSLCMSDKESSYTHSLRVRHSPYQALAFWTFS